VLVNYCRTREPFLKQGTIESYRYLLNRSAHLWRVEAESLGVAEISKFINSLKTAVPPNVLTSAVQWIYNELDQKLGQPEFPKTKLDFSCV